MRGRLVLRLTPALTLIVIVIVIDAPLFAGDWGEAKHRQPISAGGSDPQMAGTSNHYFPVSVYLHASKVLYCGSATVTKRPLLISHADKPPRVHMLIDLVLILLPLLSHTTNDLPNAVVSARHDSGQ